MKQNEKSFKTSFGKEIEFVPDLFEFFQKTRSSFFNPPRLGNYFEKISINVAGGQDKLNFKEIEKEFKDFRKNGTKLGSYGNEGWTEFYNFIRRQS